MFFLIGLLDTMKDQLGTSFHRHTSELELGAYE